MSMTETLGSVKSSPSVGHPSKVVIPVEQAFVTWKNDGSIFQEKLDGKFHLKSVAGGVLAGEMMPSGEFFAWDCVRYAGEDLRACELMTRLNAMNILCRNNGVRIVESSFDGTVLLRSVLDRGGEGVVKKSPHASYYLPMIAAKRVQVFICRVSSVGGKQSVGIVDNLTGQDRGRVSLFGGKADRIRVGSILKVEAYGETASGLLREPRPDKDSPESWLVSY